MSNFHKVSNKNKSTKEKNTRKKQKPFRIVEEKKKKKYVPRLLFAERILDFFFFLIPFKEIVKIYT